jgi:hypothetical protein
MEIAREAAYLSRDDLERQYLRWVRPLATIAKNEFEEAGELCVAAPFAKIEELFTASPDQITLETAGAATRHLLAAFSAAAMLLFGDSAEEAIVAARPHARRSVEHTNDRLWTPRLLNGLATKGYVLVDAEPTEVSKTIDRFLEVGLPRGRQPADNLQKAAINIRAQRQSTPSGHPVFLTREEARNASNWLGKAFGVGAKMQDLVKARVAGECYVPLTGGTASIGRPIVRPQSKLLPEVCAALLAGFRPPFVEEGGIIAARADAAVSAGKKRGELPPGAIAAIRRVNQVNADYKPDDGRPLSRAAVVVLLDDLGVDVGEAQMLRYGTESNPTGDRPKAP